jgi:hypothetical protein
VDTHVVEAEGLYYSQIVGAYRRFEIWRGCLYARYEGKYGAIVVLNGGIEVPSVNGLEKRKELR